MVTPEEAKALGYEVIKASAYEVGLVKGDRGVRSWWASDFDGKLPDLLHPTIMETVNRNEESAKETGHFRYVPYNE